jgi:hypothetical protein
MAAANDVERMIDAMHHAQILLHANEKYWLPYIGAIAMANVDRDTMLHTYTVRMTAALTNATLPILEEMMDIFTDCANAAKQQHGTQDILNVLMQLQDTTALLIDTEKRKQHYVDDALLAWDLQPVRQNAHVPLIELHDPWAADAHPNHILLNMIHDEAAN